MAQPFKNRSEGRKKWEKGLDNSGNIEGNSRAIMAQCPRERPPRSRPPGRACPPRVAVRRPLTHRPHPGPGAVPAARGGSRAPSEGSSGFANDQAPIGCAELLAASVVTVNSPPVAAAKLSRLHPSKNFLANHQLDIHLCTEFPCTWCRQHSPSRLMCR